MNFSDEIQKLNELFKEGALSKEEFDEAKRRLFDKNHSAGDRFLNTMDGLVGDDRVWSLFIHLSQFCGYLLPVAGWVVPILLWQVKKNHSEMIDEHGKVVVNWLLSMLLYGFLFGLLCFVVIGIPLLILLGIASVIFPIIGGIKANDGIVWEYPGSIRFF